MSWFRKQAPQPVIPRSEALSMIPVRNVEVTASTTADGLVLLAYPLAVKPWFGRLAEKVNLWDQRPMIKKLELDEMGSFVWDHIDGTRSVRRIAEEFAAHYGVQRREAELSVTAFIKNIGQRGILGLL
jgi:hypothetical protein